MVIPPMDNNTTTAFSSKERSQSLLDKTVELENKRRKAAQARTSPDPNLWQQIRENFEAIILEDHAFSEQHSIEFILWQLHYKRIEEFRSLISKAAVAASSSSELKNAKGSFRHDRVATLKLQFRTFLSEATGFYHDLILKIGSKYGLPLGYFSEDQESQKLAGKDEKKLAEVKKGLVSCHRCLIYLGDLARYKEVYGDGDSKTREYAAASSYYLQAASLLPSSGNPHHQLAIIASYSGDEFAVTYRYFRSLAVESPFPTARDNLSVAFKKNHQSYDLLLASSKDSGKGEVTSVGDAIPEKDKVASATGLLKALCIKFVRLNGIIFTWTSLEMFLDVLSSTINSLKEIISLGLGEELSFGMDASDSALFIVRLVTILTFSVHNSKKETEGQSYADIVQSIEPARNSLTASFELLGHIIEKCAQLRDPLSSFFLPGVLVFVEWLACCPDIAMGSDPDDRQTGARTRFWNHFVNLLNQILSVGPMFIDDVEDETCFSNLNMYDESETGNRVALWEDFELRGFLPLLPAQTILDFSRKHSFGTEGPKEKKARVKRILAAGKSLFSVIKVDQNPVYFDSTKKKFLIGIKPSTDLPDIPPAISLDAPLMQQRDQQFHLDEDDDDDEEIVFKPLVTEKRKEAYIATMEDFKSLNGSETSRVNASIQVSVSVGSNHLGHFHQSTQSQAVHLQQVHTQVVHPQPAQSLLAAARLQTMQPQGVHFQRTQEQVSHASQAQSQFAFLGGSKWLPEEAVSVTQMGNGHLMRNAVQGNNGVSYYPANSLPIHQSFNVNGMQYSQSQTPEAVLPPKIADVMIVQSSIAWQNPISRPSKHLGPPPGFNSIPTSKLPASGPDTSVNSQLLDDYSWLDGYQTQSSRGTGINSSLSYASHVGSSNGLNGASSFPFPGKQVPASQVRANFPYFQNPQKDNLLDESHLQEQYQGQSNWSNRHFV